MRDRSILFTKAKGILGKYNKMVDFNEPILQLIRRSGSVEWKDGVNKSIFEFTHSDGSIRKILLDIKDLKTFKYGKRKFSGYICHEDFPTPLPGDPIVTSEMIGIAIDKTLNDIAKWKSEVLKARGDMVWKIGLAVAVVIGAIALYMMLVPKDPGTAVASAVNVTKGVTNLSGIKVLG